MIELLIGLCLGALSAFALVVMWRVAGRVEAELRDPDDQPRPDPERPDGR